MKAAVLGDKGLEIRDVAGAEAQGQRDPGARARRRPQPRRSDDGEGYRHGNQGGPGTIIGLELSGEVVEAGAAVKDFRPGQRVMCSGNGGYAEYAVADAGRCSAIPANNMTFEQAATLPIGLQTMHDAIMTQGRMKKGDTVLIQAASAGVGIIGMQIARLMGARLVMGTSTRPEKRARLKEFGCDLALDSKRSALARPGARGDRRQGRRCHRRSRLGAASPTRT